MNQPVITHSGWPPLEMDEPFSRSKVIRCHVTDGHNHSSWLEVVCLVCVRDLLCPYLEGKSSSISLVSIRWL